MTHVSFALRHPRWLLLPTLSALLMLLAGCSSNGARIDRLAQTAGVQKQVVSGTLYSHVVYRQRVSDSVYPGRLLVYLESDGSPWGSSGMRPAADPTASNPLALRLMLANQANAIYVARPCYHEVLDTQCTSDRWTGGRYSQDIVDSMVRVIHNESSALDARDLVIIGYSGGGALAVLIAERLANVTAVVTIGANLDIVAWADHHRYLPLAQSLNPATSELAHPWPETHFVGERDVVVPAATLDNYFKRYPAAKRRIIAAADHICCWERDWSGLLAEALTTVN